MTGTTRRRRLLAGAALLLLLPAGCGVRPSGVITGRPAPEVEVTGVGLYLVSDGRLEFVLRSGTPLKPAGVLALLAAGPNADEQAQGLTSEVPPEIEPVEVRSGTGDVQVVLAVDPSSLTPTAVDQIVCTTLAATQPRRPGRPDPADPAVPSDPADPAVPAVPADPPGAGTTVTLTGSGHTRGPRSCPLGG